MTGLVSAISRISDLADEQWGLLTTAQAEKLDVTRLQLSRLADKGVLARVEQGVYEFSSPDLVNRHIKTAWLMLEPALTVEERLKQPISAGVASHTSAAALHGMGDLLSDIPEFIYPTRKQSRRMINIHRDSLEESEVVIIEGIPTTTIERTIVDLIRGGNDLQHISRMVGQSFQAGVLDEDRLEYMLDPIAVKHGHGSGQEFLAVLLDISGNSIQERAVRMLGTQEGALLYSSGAMTQLQKIAEQLGKEIQTLFPRSGLAEISSAERSLTEGLSRTYERINHQSLEALLPATDVSELLRKVTSLQFERGKVEDETTETNAAVVSHSEIVQTQTAEQNN